MEVIQKTYYNHVHLNNGETNLCLHMKPSIVKDNVIIEFQLEEGQESLCSEKLLFEIGYEKRNNKHFKKNEGLINCKTATPIQ